MQPNQLLFKSTFFSCVRQIQIAKPSLPSTSRKTFDTTFILLLSSCHLGGRRRAKVLHAHQCYFLLAGTINGRYCCPQLYINHRCFSGPYLNKGRIAELPQSVGPGKCVLVLKEVRLKLSFGGGFQGKAWAMGYQAQNLRLMHLQHRNGFPNSKLQAGKIG